jgi:hypothetical protein
LRLLRTDAAYASSDGRGVLFIGERETLDESDSVAQLVLHEICHALVQGEENWARPDWGLDNTTSRDDGRERACLRLQAHLADKAGLRALMMPTTEWSAYYARLPPDPFTPLQRQSREAGADPSGRNENRSADEDEEQVCAWARAGAGRAGREPTSTALARALDTTAVLVRGGGPDTVNGRHPTGFALGPSDQTCGSCAWAYKGGRGAPVARCRQTAESDGDTRRIDLAFRACDRWEPQVDCQGCGACCREAYHVVSVSVRDPVVWRQPHLIVRNGHRFSVARQGDRCAALQVTGQGGDRTFSCEIYEDRPQTCRDFARGGRHCLVARRRVGLSR